MNRYRRTFEQLRQRGETAFIPFAVAGDPDIATSEAVFATYVDHGADVLEIGYPFSDPIADGPVNQRAAARAIAAGLTPARFFRLLRGIRARTDIPIGLLLYTNTIMHSGVETFCSRAADAGVDSLLVADQPPEESGELTGIMKRHGLSTVHIVSELTPPERIRRICRRVDGFVYVVSRLGPTGTQSDFSTTVAETLRRLRAHTELPLCVGFGISTPEHVGAVKRAGADGAVVGSALVGLIEKNPQGGKRLLSELGRRVAAYKRATR